MKELNECARLGGTSPVDISRQRVIFVKEALHRNEETGEVEPQGHVDEYLDNKNKKVVSFKDPV